MLPWNVKLVRGAKVVPEFNEKILTAHAQIKDNEANAMMLLVFPEIRASSSTQTHAKVDQMKKEIAQGNVKHTREQAKGSRHSRRKWPSAEHC